MIDYVNLLIEVGHHFILIQGFGRHHIFTRDKLAKTARKFLKENVTNKVYFML